MEILGYILIVVGISAFIISDFMILVKAFKKSLWWGFGSLIIPIVALAFIIIHWDKTKKYVGWLILSAVVFVFGGTLIRY